jgi:hypothetical protein
VQFGKSNPVEAIPMAVAMILRSQELFLTIHSSPPHKQREPLLLLAQQLYLPVRSLLGPSFRRLSGNNPMPILTANQITAAAQAFAQAVFVIPKVTATLSTTQIIAGITAIDTVMSSTPSSFGTTYTASANVGAALGAAVTAAVPGISTTLAGLMLIFWTKQITGIFT